jgi:hypothetical protein
LFRARRAADAVDTDRRAARGGSTRVHNELITMVHDGPNQHWPILSAMTALGDGVPTIHERYQRFRFLPAMSVKRAHVKV